MTRENAVPRSTVRVAVIGAGGVGGYFGGVLARAGHWTALLARGEHLKAIQQHQLHIKSPKGDFAVTPALATDRIDRIGPVDLVLVAVKAWQLSAVAEQLPSLLTETTRVLPLQNGVEAAEHLASFLPRDNVLVGVCRIVTAVSAPGCVQHLALEPTIHLGELDARAASPPTRAVAAVLAAAGVTTVIPANIQEALWEKFVFIAGVSGVGAAARSTIGEIRACPPTRTLLQRIIEEAVQVANAQRIHLPSDVVARTMQFIDAMAPAATTSMQRDIASGRPSELDAILGVLVRFGAQHGVSTPAAEALYGSLLPQEERARTRLGTPPDIMQVGRSEHEP